VSTASSPLDGDAPAHELTEDDPTAVDDRLFDQDADAPRGDGEVDLDEDDDATVESDHRFFDQDVATTTVVADVEPDDTDEHADTDERERVEDEAPAETRESEGAGPTEAVEELGDELDAELEAEAAAMAPLVELPDRATFAAPLADPEPTPEPAAAPRVPGEALTVRVRGHGRVPARKVRRVIRRVDPLSVLKLSFFFNVCLFAMFLIAAVLLWSAAIGSGSTDNIESFVIEIGFEDFKLVGADLFRGFVVFGAGLVVAGTVFSVLLSLLFNLISDIVGGIRFTVIEPSIGPDDPAPSDA
jgi:hypothetical protein